jgi:dCTP deaminase
MFVDKQIKDSISNGEIVIDIYDEKNIAPAGYYFHLGKTLLIPEPGQIINPMGGDDPKYQKIDISTETYNLKPGEFVLGQTKEKLSLSNNIGMFIDGRTTLARLGLSIHITATWIHPGHTDSIITLEIHNSGNHILLLQENLSIGKGIFFKSTEVSEVAYNQMGIYPTQSEVMGADVPPYNK